jgi:drug/metabolite transporter (DMT)-like permease
LIGLLALLAFIAWRTRTGRLRLAALRTLPRRAQVTLLVAAVMGLTLNVGMFISFDRVTVALTLLCFYTYPAMIAVVNVGLGRERIDATRGAALVLALIGMLAVVASQLDPAAGVRFDALGVSLALGAALSQTVYVVVSRDGYRQVPPEQAIVVVMLVTAVGATLIALIVGGVGALAVPIGEPGFLALLLFTGILAAAVPAVGLLVGIRSIGGLRAGILMLFEPVVGVGLAAVLLGEGLASVQILGAAAIMVAAVILQRAAAESGDLPAAGAVAAGGGP